MGAQNIANGSAALEPDFSANTINTTWYSNGEQLTGNNIPGTCRYDAALTPPTPAARPGYVFGGWRLKVPCLVPQTLVNTNGNYMYSHGWDNDTDYCTDGITFYGDTTNCLNAVYNNIALNEWMVTWENGDVIKGEALCSATDGLDIIVGNPYTSGTGDARYCWCRVKAYTASGSQQCDFESPSWVFGTDGDEYYRIEDCKHYCSYQCAHDALRSTYKRGYLFTGLVAQ